jgi:hypothetical protein
MTMIFPGMDPYLEDPLLWPGFHSRLVVYLADQLQPQLRPRYIAAVEDRVFLEETQRAIIPDVWVRERLDFTTPDDGGGVAVLEATAVATEESESEADEELLISLSELDEHESYIEILDRQSGQRIVTVIEVLSPTNKVLGRGRESYKAKQREVLASTAHLVEIDLLREGEHTVAVPQAAVVQHRTYDYLVSVNRARDLRGDFSTYPRWLRERLPRIRIPLANGDRDVTLNVQAAVAQTYEAGSYRDRLKYGAECVPALRSEDQSWANELIRAALSK